MKVLSNFQSCVTLIFGTCTWCPKENVGYFGTHSILLLGFLDWVVVVNTNHCFAVLWHLNKAVWIELTHKECDISHLYTARVTVQLPEKFHLKYLAQPLCTLVTFTSLDHFKGIHFLMWVKVKTSALVSENIYLWFLVPKNWTGGVLEGQMSQLFWW